MIEIDLHQFIQSEIGKPFNYGEHDCATFAAKALDIITGGGMFDTIQSRRIECNDLIPYMEKYGSIGEHFESVGGKEVDVSFASTGDFIVIEHAEGQFSACVCMGARTAVNTEERGVLLFPTSKLQNIIGVWRVR
jgi:hypothetical protein